MTQSTIINKEEEQSIRLDVSPFRAPNRSKYEIYRDILELSRRGCRKTRILALGNLSWQTLIPMLGLLIRNDLIELANFQGIVRSQYKSDVYITTQKGRLYLEKFKELDEMVQEIRISKRQEVQD